MDIKLSLINESADTNNSHIVIFQKNVAANFDNIDVAWKDDTKTHIAWKVIKNCGRDDSHPFSYPMNFAVGASDSFGNYTPQIDATDGQAYDMLKEQSGDVLLQSKDEATNANEVEIRNNLATGAISANCYRGGKLLAAKTGLAPGQKAVFEFQPTIYIGVVSQIEEGDVMNSAIISQVKTPINLIGITSADIVMTGGGSGVNAVPFAFTLKNMNK